MDSRFELEVTDFLDACLEKVLTDLKSNDPEYASDKEYVESNSQKLEDADGYRMHYKTSAKHDEIMNGLSKDVKLFVEEYWMNFFDKVSIENKHLYYSGYKDCIKFLKRLGVI